MSRHSFDTVCDGRPVQVVMGWDRPLQYVFMSVERLDEPDEYLYSNLDDEHAKNDVGYFLAKLNALGITVPASMIVEVVADRANNVGNRVVVHTMDGPPL